MGAWGPIIMRVDSPLNQCIPAASRNKSGAATATARRTRRPAGVFLICLVPRLVLPEREVTSLNDLFSEPLNLYYEQAFDNARARLKKLACDSLIGKTDDRVARELVADRMLELPALVEGEAKTELVGDHAEYTHTILNPASLRFKPDRLLVAYAGYARERLDGDRHVISVLREPGMTPEQARAKYDDWMRMFRQNLDGLAAQITQGNSNLVGRLLRFVADRREECDDEASFKSGM